MEHPEEMELGRVPTWAQRICCPCVLCMTPDMKRKLKVRCARCVRCGCSPIHTLAWFQAAVDHWAVQCFVLLCTVFALFGDDIFLCTLDRRSDPTLSGISFAILLIYVIELYVLSCVDNFYGRPALSLAYASGSCVARGSWLLRSRSVRPLLLAGRGGRHLDDSRHRLHELVARAGRCVPRLQHQPVQSQPVCSRRM